jgi:hypothetical protein
VLAAPAPQLSGDGQLRELIEERRGRFGERADVWHLHPGALRALALGNPDEEAVVAADPAVVIWLQLRFGGRLGTVRIERAALENNAAATPTPVPQVQLAWS